MYIKKNVFSKTSVVLLFSLISIYGSTMTSVLRYIAFDRQSTPTCSLCKGLHRKHGTGANRRKYVSSLSRGDPFGALRMHPTNVTSRF